MLYSSSVFDIGHRLAYAAQKYLGVFSSSSLPAFPSSYLGAIFHI